MKTAGLWAPLRSATGFKISSVFSRRIKTLYEIILAQNVHCTVARSSGE